MSYLEATPSLKRRCRSAAAALLFAAGLGLAAPQTGFAAEVAGQSQTAVTKATLENGLQVVIVRNTLAPVVSTVINYNVGANETPKGFPGTAHAQEHMMFRGSPDLSADQLADIGSLMGGSFNADTRQTVTQYYFTVPSDDLDVALHIEAIRMQEVNDSDEDWKTERGAIEQEVARDLSNPLYVLDTQLREALFKGTPYEMDALGSKESFDKTTGAMLKEFHDTWYAPNNAVLIIAGDLDPAKTLAKVKELFGPIRKRDLPKRPEINLQPVAPQALNLKTDLPYAMQVFAFRMPGFEDPDWPAMEVLSDVLDSDRGAFQDLVANGDVLQAGFSVDPLPKASMAYVAATFPVGGDTEAVAGKLRGVIEKIAKDGVPADMVEEAKQQERRQAEFQKNSIQGLANVWSEAVAVYGLSSPDVDLERIEKVTAADVNRAAAKYLTLTHAISAVLTPESSGKPVASQGFGGQEEIALGKTDSTPLPAWAEEALSDLKVPESTVHPVVSTLPNGIKLIVQPETVSDTVSVYGSINNRSELDVPKGKDGLGSILDQLFDFGTASYDRIAFQKELNSIGASESAGTSFSVGVLTENFDRAVALLADNELHPALPEEAFKIVQRQLSQSTAGRIKSPSYIAGKALRTALFPEGDPSRREALPETINSITYQDLKDYYAKVIRPDLATIVVIGNVTPEKARATIEKYFGQWKAEGQKPPTELPAVPNNKPDIIAVPDVSRSQASVSLAESIGITRQDPDYYALDLGNAVLGGSLYSTRLTRDLRKNAGLVYSVDSELDSGKTRGFYFLEYACDPQNVGKVHDMIVSEIRTMQTAPVNPDELQRAKAVLIRQIPLAASSMRSIAGGLIHRVEEDLPLDEPTEAAAQYLKLDAAAVQAAYAKWLRPQDLIRVTLGPAGE